MKTAVPGTIYATLLINYRGLGLVLQSMTSVDLVVEKAVNPTHPGRRHTRHFSVVEYYLAQMLTMSTEPDAKGE